MLVLAVKGIIYLYFPASENPSSRATDSLAVHSFTHDHPR